MIGINVRIQTGAGARSTLDFNTCFLLYLVQAAEPAIIKPSFSAVAS